MYLFLATEEQVNENGEILRDSFSESTSRKINPKKIYFISLKQFLTHLREITYLARTFFFGKKLKLVN